MKKGFWFWQFIIAIFFIILSCCVAYFMKDEYVFMPRRFISIGSLSIPLNYWILEWGIWPTFIVISINIVYYSLRKRASIGYRCNSCSIKAILFEVLKYIEIIGTVLFLIIVWFITGLIANPLHLLITVWMVAIIVCSLLKKEHWKYLVFVCLIFIAVGIYFIFNNELPGPMTWSIADRPMDVPRTWLYHYRFYWWGVVVTLTFLHAGFISFCFLALLKLFKLCRYKFKK